MHPAWFMVGLAFAIQFVGSAVGVYSFGILLGPLVEDLDATRASVSLINFYMSIAGAVFGPLLGRAVLRIPLNQVMAAGAISLSVSFLANQRFFYSPNIVTFPHCNSSKALFKIYIYPNPKAI